MAFKVRILPTSATFRLYSGAEKEAPMATEVFLLNRTSRGNSSEEKNMLTFLIAHFMFLFLANLNFIAESLLERAEQ